MRIGSCSNASHLGLTIVVISGLAPVVPPEAKWIAGISPAMTMEGAWCGSGERPLKQRRGAGAFAQDQFYGPKLVNIDGGLATQELQQEFSNPRSGLADG